MPRNRRIRGGLSSPVIAALVATMPDPGVLWPLADRHRWLGALQAALEITYRRVEEPRPFDVEATGADDHD